MRRPKVEQEEPVQDCACFVVDANGRVVSEHANVVDGNRVMRLGRQGVHLYRTRDGARLSSKTLFVARRRTKDEYGRTLVETIVLDDGGSDGEEG